MTVDSQWDFDALSGDTRTAEQNASGAEATNALMASVLSGAVSDPPAVPDPEDPHVDLPGGLYWDGELLRTAEVRELTGTDEEALAAVRGSLARWMSLLLERTVVRIGDLTPTPAAIRRLLIGDRDELLLGVRIVTFGPTITLQHVVCPHCEQPVDLTVDLRTIDRVVLDSPAPRHEYTVPLRRGGTAVVRLPDGAAQEKTFGDDDRMTSAQRNTILLSECLVSVTDSAGQPVALSGEALAQNLGMADRQIILQYLSEHQPGPRLDDIRIQHDGCGQEVRLPLTLPELFRI